MSSSELAALARLGLAPAFGTGLGRRTGLGRCCLGWTPGLFLGGGFGFDGLGGNGGFRFGGGHGCRSFLLGLVGFGGDADLAGLAAALTVFERACENLSSSNKQKNRCRLQNRKWLQHGHARDASLSGKMGGRTFGMQSLRECGRLGCQRVAGTGGAAVALPDKPCIVPRIVLYGGAQSLRQIRILAWRPGQRAILVALKPKLHLFGRSDMVNIQTMAGRWRLWCMAMVLFVFTGALGAADLLALTEPLPPLNYEQDGKVVGFSSELLDLVAHEAGLSVESKFCLGCGPMTSSVDKATPLSIHWVRTPEREALSNGWGPSVRAES